MWSGSRNSTGRGALLVAGALLAAALHAQSAPELLLRMQRAHQEDASVYLKRNTTFRFERAPGGTVAFREVVEQRLMLKDMAGSAYEQEVHYSGLVPLSGLEAYTQVPHKNGYKRVRVGTVEHRDERDDNIFHDDSRVARFVMPSLVAGAIANVSYTLSYPDARLASGHFFASMAPTEESTLTVISDPGVEVDIRTFHLPDSLVTRSTTLEKGRTVQRFTMRRVPALRFESNAPAARYYAPHAHLVVRVPESAPVENDIERMYLWEREHIRATFGAVDPELLALSDSITAGATDPREKAARLHRWVQDHIRYVAFEDGMNGLIPAPATEVCRVRYGDCKGMSNLLYSLLRGAGLNAHLTWVGTRSLPYTFTELPTLANTNHMIVALDLDGTTLFLDPTADANAFGVPSGFTQGKEALIALDSLRHRVERIPVMPASANTVTDSVRLRIEGAALAGSGTARFTGYERYNLAHMLEATKASRHNELLRAVLMKGSNKFLLDGFSIEGLEDREAPLVITYDFRIPDLVRGSGNRLYVPLTLTDPWEDHRIREDRRLPLEFPHLALAKHSVTLELPEGARCKGLPIRDAKESEGFGYDIRIDGADGTVSSNATFRIGELLIDKGLGDWHRMNNALLKELGRALVIELPTP